MIEFNVKLWKERAWNRYGHVAKHAGKKKTAIAETNWYHDVLYANKIKIVVGWCASKKLDVRFGKTAGAIYDGPTRTIRISGRASPEKQLYYLLHERGHHLIGFAEGDDRFSLGYLCVDDPAINATFQHRLACLEEEIEAWDRGWRLSKRLNLNINRAEFDKLRIVCLRSYIRWTNSKKLLKSI